MARYLTQEWLDEFCSLAKHLPEKVGASITIQYKATGGRDGDIDYFWKLEDGRMAEAMLGVADDAAVTITMTYENAAKLQRGELKPMKAMMLGKMKASGNVGRMMSFVPITGSAEWQAIEQKVTADTEF